MTNPSVLLMDEPTEGLERARTRHLYSYQVALVYAGLGRLDEAFDWLERSYQERSPMLSYLKMDPRLDNLRPDARFGDLLRRINMTALANSVRRRGS